MINKNRIAWLEKSFKKHNIILSRIISESRVTYIYCWSDFIRLTNDNIHILRPHEKPFTKKYLKNIGSNNKNIQLTWNTDQALTTEVIISIQFHDQSNLIMEIIIDALEAWKEIYSNLNTPEFDC